MQASTHKQEALKLRLQGFSYAKVAEQLGISRQRVAQLTQPPKEVRRFVVSQADGKCQSCGLEIAHGHVHHKQAKGLTEEDYSDITNLEYLCLVCHREKHQTSTPHEVVYLRLPEDLKAWPREERRLRGGSMQDIVIQAIQQAQHQS